VPAPEQIFRYQKALLWRSSGVPDNYGRPTHEPPEELLVRWNHTRAKAVAANGEGVTLDAQVVVNEAIPMDSLLWLAPDQSPGSPCASEQWYGSDGGSGSAVRDNELMVVKTFEEVPDAKGRLRARKLGLMRLAQSPS
jgi:hypothetical protein